MGSSETYPGVWQISTCTIDFSTLVEFKGEQSLLYLLAQCSIGRKRQEDLQTVGLPPSGTVPFVTKLDH